MKILQLIKRYRIAVGVLIASYALNYCYLRYTHILIHRVSYDVEVYHHSIDTGDLRLSLVGFIQPIFYIGFTPLRWSEALVWDFIPRHYEIY